MNGRIRLMLHRHVHIFHVRILNFHFQISFFLSNIYFSQAHSSSSRKKSETLFRMWAVKRIFYVKMGFDAERIYNENKKTVLRNKQRFMGFFERNLFFHSYWNMI